MVKRWLSSRQWEINFWHTSSWDLWTLNSSKMFNSSACSRDILLRGLNSSIFTTREIKSLLALLKYKLCDFFWMSNWFIKFSAVSLSTESMSSLEGIPVNCKILPSWSTVESPGNRADPINNSLIMHPKLQISVYFPYLFEPNSSSGDRYHLVATSSVKIMTSSSSCIRLLTIPKSHNLTTLKWGYFNIGHWWGYWMASNLDGWAVRNVDTLMLWSSGRWQSEYEHPLRHHGWIIR